MAIELVLERDMARATNERTPGRLFGRFGQDSFSCYSLEDADRRLEDNPEGKVYGKTAIPRGRYRVTLSMSRRWRKVMPEILGVPTHAGVRFHGGNDEDDTEGCPLLGARSSDNWPFVSDCAGVNHQLSSLIKAAYEAGEEVWVTVR
jgi:hypothetical protein